jgi:hypothetical protein
MYHAYDQTVSPFTHLPHHPTFIPLHPALIRSEELIYAAVHDSSDEKPCQRAQPGISILAYPSTRIMAHPLTQHPFSSIPFPSAPRPSPLGFGFAAPSPSAFRNPTTPPITPLSFGITSFGSSASSHTKRPGFAAPASVTPSTAPLKRQRRSISPGSSSPSPSSSAGSPRSGKGKEKDELGVEGLDLTESESSVSRKLAGRKGVKRFRKEHQGKALAGQVAIDTDVDIGLLLGECH